MLLVLLRVRRQLGSPVSERAALRVRRRPPSPPPRPAAGRVSVLLRMCRGRAAGWCLARLLCLPSGSPLAFSGRAACGCQSRGRAIRLRAGSGPAPSVFLIKEAAAETRGAEPRAAAHSSGGAALADNPVAARSKLGCQRTLQPLSSSPHLPPALRTLVQGCGCVSPSGRSTLLSGRSAPAVGKLHGAGEMLVPPKFRDSDATHAESNIMPPAMALQGDLGGGWCSGLVGSRWLSRVFAEAAVRDGNTCRQP